MRHKKKPKLTKFLLHSIVAMLIRAIVFFPIVEPTLHIRSTTKIELTLPARTITIK